MCLLCMLCMSCSRVRFVCDWVVCIVMSVVYHVCLVSFARAVRT